MIHDPLKSCLAFQLVDCALRSSNNAVSAAVCDILHLLISLLVGRPSGLTDCLQDCMCIQWLQQRMLVLKNCVSCSITSLTMTTDSQSLQRPHLRNECPDDFKFFLCCLLHCLWPRYGGCGISFALPNKIAGLPKQHSGPWSHQELELHWPAIVCDWSQSGGHACHEV